MPNADARYTNLYQDVPTLILIRSWAAAYHVHTEFEVESLARNDMDGTNLFQNMLENRKMRLSVGWTALQRLAWEKPESVLVYTTSKVLKGISESATQQKLQAVSRR